MTSEPNQPHSTLRERQKQARIDAIILSAKKLFLENGYAETTIEMIADTALVSAPTIYNYFKTKDRLLLALIQKCDEEIIALLYQSIEHPKSSADKEIAHVLILIVSASLNSLDSKIWRYAFAYKVLESTAEIGSGYRKMNNEIYSTVEKLLKILISQDKLPEATDVSYLRGLFQHLNHALFGEIISNNGISFTQYEKTIRNYVRIIISGIK